jgi:hypothetical protein
LAVPVLRDAEALQQDVVHEAHADVDIHAHGLALPVEVRPAGELKRLAHVEHRHLPGVFVDAGSLRPAVHAIVSSFEFEVRTKQHCEELKM